MVAFLPFARRVQAPVLLSVLALAGSLPGAAQLAPPLVGGSTGSGARPTQSALASGFYHALSCTGALAGPGLTPPLMGASLDHKTKKLYLFLPDGSYKRLSLVPRPKGQWKAECYLNAEQYVLCEVAGLKTQSLTLGTFTFQAPVLEATCSGSRMILREGKPGPEATAIVLEVQPACTL